MAGHGGHGHDDGDEIVLHQERLLPTMLLAGAFAIVVLFGLSAAGGAKLDVTTGKAAYEKVRAEMPKIEKHIPMQNPNANYKTPDGKEHNQSNVNEHTEEQNTQGEEHNHGH
jgi:hypothetical protein